jgi:predicted house-cleaning noncanonical NTP pyrophosphatase (MazG superfamily)
MKQGKLIRNRIPEIIREKGGRPVTRLADDKEYWEVLKAKLKEEVEEFVVSESPEELADILEVIEAIVTYRHLDQKALEKLRLAKKKTRGGFTKRLILTGK